MILFHQPFLQINNRKDNIYNMNFDEMTLDELKEYAKQNNIKVGNIGREKLIEKLKSDNTSVCSIADDDDFVEDTKAESTPEPVAETKSTLGSIIDAIDDLEESDISCLVAIESSLILLLCEQLLTLCQRCACLCLAWLEVKCVQKN